MSNPVSPKVSAAAVASAGATLVVTTIAAHLFHGAAPADVLRLAEAGLTAAITFAAGWFARVLPAGAVREVARWHLSPAYLCEYTSAELRRQPCGTLR